MKTITLDYEEFEQLQKVVDAHQKLVNQLMTDEPVILCVDGLDVNGNFIAKIVTSGDKDIIKEMAKRIIDLEKRRDKLISENFELNLKLPLRKRKYIPYYK